MPNRVIRDGINTSARINALTDGAELFYRRLMSVADDFGRFYGHPSTLRIAAWPTHPDKHTDEEARAWLDELTSGADPLVVRYSVGGADYIQIEGFRQRTRSEKSKFPDPPDGTVKHGGRADNPPTIDGQLSANGGGNSALDGDGDGDGDGRRENDESPTTGQALSRAEGMPRAEATRARTTTPTTNERTQTLNPPRKAPVRSQSSRSHDDGEGNVTDTDTVRASLRALAPLVRLPIPDDDLVGLVLSAARGAPGDQIHSVLRQLYLGRKFENIRSWGLIPIVVAQCFRDYVCDDTAQSAAS